MTGTKSSCRSTGGKSGYVARQSIFILSEAKDEQGTT
jgi:hypothetical protein